MTTPTTDKRNEPQLVVRLDKTLRKQFSLCAQSQNTSMNKAVNEFIRGYVKKHYPAVIAEIAELGS